LAGNFTQSKGFYIFFSVFSLVLVSVEKIYQAIKTMFDYLSKHLEVRQKYSTDLRIFSFLLRLLKCDQTRSFVFHILLTNSSARESISQNTKHTLKIRSTAECFFFLKPFLFSIVRYYCSPTSSIADALKAYDASFKVTVSTFLFHLFHCSVLKSAALLFAYVF